MKYTLYLYRDHLKNDFSLPMIEVNDQVMTRNFENLCKTDPSMSFSPGDYDLFKVGSYDSESGLFDTSIPEFIVNGGSLIG